MSYRGPFPKRIGAQVNSGPRAAAGLAVTWRQWVSASSGVDVAGFGATDHYREQRITAFLGRAPVQFNVPEVQTDAGSVAAGKFLCTTREKLDRRDLLVWEGDLYRVESEATPARLAGHWTVEVKRAGE